jgi:hypothetical protein
MAVPPFARAVEGHYRHPAPAFKRAAAGRFPSPTPDLY